MTRNIPTTLFPIISGDLYTAFNDFTALCELDCDADADELLHSIQFWISNSDYREYTYETLLAMREWLQVFRRAWIANPPE